MTVDEEIRQYAAVLAAAAPPLPPDVAQALVLLLVPPHDEGAPGRAPRHCTVPAGRVAERRSTGAA